jgi:hypothetical protein
VFSQYLMKGREGKRRREEGRKEGRKEGGREER